MPVIKIELRQNNLFVLSFKKTGKFSTGKNQDDNDLSLSDKLFNKMIEK